MSEVRAGGKGARSNARLRIRRKQAIETWLKFSLVDLLVASELKDADLVPLRLSLLHQGLEKLGKAYLIGAQAESFEHLDARQASEWIDQCARRYEHGLSNLLALVGVGVPALRGYQNHPSVGLLETAYLGGRYPSPTSKGMFSRHVAEDVFGGSHASVAFAIARTILTAIENDFGVSVLARGEFFFPTISPERWQKFVDRIQRQRPSQEESLAKFHADITELFRREAGLPARDGPTD